ncbi:type VI secretion system Vgr family protein [Chitinophaga nivalis]|uniref:Phage baseplate assembly protein V n=1 Tax=Chitinophaga nivalis TaxID=2991709 RepID=A0ABT3IT17_9BACT|nr:phage baseplate assembly protein V [Chitinophaga nivalis]MCW3463184.1 phage baseplate assembly protein V [Chitinophaga nivalis]MCW3487126.1 phage baseplate assembly protein V [Chitinophaga nivalis]
MSLNTHAVIAIAGKQFRHFRHLTLQQQLNGHHTCSILFSYDGLLSAGQELSTASQAFLGKELHITIRPAEPAHALRELVFQGLVTAVCTGKETDDTHGYCLVKGHSPTIVLDGDPHLQSFEQQTLRTVIQAVIKKGAPFIDTALIDPAHTAILPYTVQYRESHFAFIQRLAQRFGEWCFYNGQHLVFGNYTPRDIILTHPATLTDFHLQWQVRPRQQQWYTYDYQQPAVVTAPPHPAGDRLPGVVQTAIQASHQLFSATTREKALQAFASPATLPLTQLATLHDKSKLAGMLQLQGTSIHPALRIGDTVSIRENLYTDTQHGGYTLTAITHYCNGSGEYHNQFSGIPAGSAAPYGSPDVHPPCEAQSAIVTDNHDPQGLGRIRVRFHWQTTGQSPWIRLVLPHSGASKGFYFMPETGEEVWTGFENNHPELPYVYGSLYNGIDYTSFGDAANNRKIIKTRSGHTIQLDDTHGAEQLTICDRSGNHITLDTSTGNLTIAAPAQLQLTATNIRLQASENIYLHAGENIAAGAGENVHIHAGSHASQTARHIVQHAQENCTRTAHTLTETAEAIHFSSTQENMVLSAAKTIAIKSAEKVKLF